MMVRVCDAREASRAAAAGIDAVEFVVSDDASPDLRAIRETRDAFPRLLRLRGPAPDLSPALVETAAAVGAEEVAYRLDPLQEARGATSELPGGVKAVGIVSACDEFGAVRHHHRHIGAVMLEAGGPARLIDAAPIAAIDAFATACRHIGLGFGLAGGLEAPDVARLLLLAPDVLAFDTAVRANHAPDGALDPHALDAIRALVPRDRARSAVPRIAKVIDRIFVRDFEVALAIGAYQSEHGKRQRVRFSVVAETVREARPPQDMRDVFSYDIIIETIRVLAERDHVAFVETLAEEVAAALLAHAEVVAVEVKVEKLDVVQGSVGIEIQRRRAAT